MKAAKAHNEIDPIFIHTGQHYDYEMSQVFLEELNLPKINHFLDVKSGPHGQQTALLLTEIERCLVLEKPQVVIVLGDTNTTMAGALASAKLQIPVAHVEAGCRSFDLDMPEEINRLIVDALSSIFFAPSEVAALNLLFEGKASDRVFLAGNSIADIVEETKEVRRTKDLDREKIGEFDVLMTLHRQENVDDKERLTGILNAVGKIQGKVIFPIHPRTRKRIDEFQLDNLVENLDNLKLIKPLNYLTFMNFLENAKVVITDSGGVQEEAILVGTTCITTRDTTEWPETVWAGGNFLAGEETETIHQKCNELLKKSRAAKHTLNPFKGNAGVAIINTLLELWRTNQLGLKKPDMSGGKYPLPWLLSKDQKPRNEFQTSLFFDANGKASHRSGVTRIARISKNR